MPTTPFPIIPEFSVEDVFGAFCGGEVDILRGGVDVFECGCCCVGGFGVEGGFYVVEGCSAAGGAAGAAAADDHGGAGEVFLAVGEADRCRDSFSRTADNFCIGVTASWEILVLQMWRRWS
ncbi:hypothetical protein APU90_09940 [Rathayibacter toxicus]|nr:hypothetical protein APU90_09940 [Rathayibacter toxicus]QWL32164.1 hypothetical protein E2R35_04455 [Rathayibacter toxicus]QWL36390.1 hypothetical protein E2R37_04455 [Rathayibacter toxicus]